MENVKPIRILHVVGAMNRAGTETMLMNIYRNIDREKVTFDFISYSEQEAHYDAEIERLGGRVIRLSKTRSVKQLYQAIRQYGPYDVVHAHTLFHCGVANMAAFMAGIKIRIAHAHTTADDDFSFVRKSYIMLMRLMISTFSTNLLACSNGAGKYLFGGNRVAKQKYSYFPNPIDYVTFLKEPKIEVTKFKVKKGFGTSLVIGHIGRFIEAKNHAFLLQVMKRVVERNPTIKLLLVGDGDLRQQVEKEAKKEDLHENIRFVGIQTNISTMLHCMDVFVFPSLYEGLGLVLLEAQASGVPCVVSEAIQPEADLEIGLVSKLTLANGPDVWAKRILEVANKKEKNTNKIIETFEEKGYSLTKGISSLMNIYKYSDGGAHEEYSNRFL
ncbi:glycosyltransferase family 1 protein [Virgibacillus necropolis]|uniref:Capsular biosynthesis protein n=1 Tax=Virgibacillus necropolis TaxID=163877 RepID=A0A221MEF3_9BACI|nr:glycosyltransferase family 1 protein [Virgibacillus necropolis]ASN05992.1 capsular biosynthesis protein [Virgibacillus necropolis]